MAGEKDMDGSFVLHFQVWAINTSHSVLQVILLPICQLEVKDYRDLKVGRIKEMNE